MARHVVKRDQGNEPVPVDKAPEMGGTSGAPPDPHPPTHIIHGIDDITPARVVEARPDDVVAKRYRVKGGPDSVVYDGQRVRVNPGNIYSDANTDIALLVRQGVQLEELT